MFVISIEGIVEGILDGIEEGNEEGVIEGKLDGIYDGVPVGEGVGGIVGAWLLANSIVTLSLQNIALSTHTPLFFIALAVAFLPLELLMNFSYSLFSHSKWNVLLCFHCIEYCIDILVASSCEHDCCCCSNDVFSRVFVSSSCKFR